jgi:hypothetical protein
LPHVRTSPSTAVRRPVPLAALRLAEHVDDHVRNRFAYKRKHNHLMKWPFVSRSSLDRALEQCASWRDAYLLERGAHCTTRDRLLLTVDKLTTLQRAGFTAAPVVPDAPVQTQILPPKVIAAIRQHMDPRGPAGRSTVDWARSQIAAGQSEDTVIGRIHAGSDGDAA